MERAELKPGEYQCCLCGGVFEFGWTDEEAEAELKQDGKIVPVPDDEMLPF